MVEPNIVLILGDDQADKDQKVSLIKKRFLADNPGLGDFNIDDIDGQALTLKTLQEILKRLPFKSKQRLLIIRAADRLSESTTEYLLKSLKQLSDSHFRIVFCAGSQEDKAANKLLAVLKQSQFVNKLSSQLKRKIRVFDLARDIIEYGNIFSSLSILRQLLLDGKQAPQILGGLFWYWNNSKGVGTKRDLGKDLELFLDTDVKIKTGMISFDLALELLVVKLCQRQYS